MWSIAGLAGILLATQSGCGNFFKKFAANSTVDVFADGAEAFQKESDVELARTAGLANLKILEGLLETVPENEKLLGLCARSFTEFAFAFLEGEMGNYGEFDEEYEVLLGRATDYYTRAVGYSKRRLKLRNEGLYKAIESGDIERLEKRLERAEKEDASDLFWVAYPWGSRINLTLDDPESLIELPTILAIMERVAELDETIFHGAPRLFLGGAYASVPPALGGDPGRSKENFESALKIEEGRYFMAKVLYAEYYFARAQPNREAFIETLESVVDADLEIAPEYRLANGLAQSRAARLISRADDIF